jgi:hypothetical protein
MMQRDLICEPEELIPDLKLVSNRIQRKSVPSRETVLKELFILLEDYAPVWYTKEHHDRVIAALLEREF